jgi:phage terminase small subunit
VTCRPGHSPRHPAFGDGNQLARTQGVWAADASDEAARVVGNLLPPSDIERYPLIALIFAETWIRWRRAKADITARGEMLGDDGEAKAHPLLPVEGRLRRDLLDLVARFGLDPKSESELARSRADAAKLSVDLEAVLDRGRAAWAARAAPQALTVGEVEGGPEDGP